MVTATKSRITVPFIKVISMFLEYSNEPFAGSEVFKKTKLNSGTVYPLLAAMVDNGWLKTEWEVVDVNDTDRSPPRKMYRITECGYHEAVELLSDNISPSFARSFNPPATV